MDDLYQTIPKSLYEEIKLFQFGDFVFYLKDLAAAAVVTGLFICFSAAVNGWLLIPYILFGVLTFLYLIGNIDASNPGRRNWQGLQYYLFRNRETVYSLNGKQEDGYNE
ncbi:MULTISPECIES: DUF5592 family protein [Caproicibacterium]|uniref:DUF5592 family protein n=1 Tax=Caproicibacterium argilliputei TaxID=3030016 RepID=A0AA97D9R4_9FIRM|nr:DUF5592 family protein [Caproicibacterium argilliputei]WOC32364.1 DUF5592 family protein [Caproicibacterium argilliputei]